MSSTKTGNPGFEIDGKTWVYDVGEQVDPIPADAGDIKVDNTIKDISVKTKTTLSQYMSAKTQGNVYPVDAKYVETKITDEKSLPTEASSQPTNTAQFSNRTTASGVTSDSPDLRSSRPNPVPDPATTLGMLTKGKRSPKFFDGNRLLPEVSKNNLPIPINLYTNSVLSNNRFTSAAKSAAEVTGIDNDNKPNSAYNPILHHPRYGEVAMNRLAQIGTSLSLRASQELGAASQGNNPTGGTQELAALLPGFNQLGASRIETTVLEARDVLVSLTTEEVPEGDFLNIGNLSWGALNNVDDQFTGILALGMIALSVALTAAVVLMFEGLSLLLTMIKGSSVGAARATSGRYALGSHSMSKGSDPTTLSPLPNISKLLGVRNTIFPFEAALKKGTLAFFGAGAGGFSDIVSAGMNAPAFNSIVARAIIRSSLYVIDAFKKAFNSPNLVAGVKNLMSIIEIIKTSKLIAAMNVFAGMGDMILSEGDLTKIIGDRLEGEPIKISTVDAIPDDSPASAVHKNRLSGRLKLAWASNRTPSMLMIPGSVLTMSAIDNKLGGFKGPIALTDDKGKTTYKNISANVQKENGARIPLADVEKLENQLEAEYVPFYFHDIRTNEIISFHAFIASLTDDFTATPEKTDAYGRVDPILIYKNTHRKIGMSFYIVAGDEKDFDDMWVKINKLVTLVYPQYTKGRMLNDGVGTAFIQPFSQMISASPLVRIRLGDLIRSNYSRFALARLFGAADGVMSLDKIPVKFGDGDSIAQQILKSLSANKPIISSAVKYACNSAGYSEAPTGAAGLLSAAVGLGGIGGGAAGPEHAPTLNIDTGDLQYLEFEAKSDTSYVVSVISSSDLQERGIDVESATTILASINFRYNSNKNIKQFVVGGTYTIPFAMMSMTQKAIKSLLTAASSDTENFNKLADFLSSKNALVKSFQSTQGKGLAGMIETMNFDWYDKVTWDTRLGHKAPKMCKVSISFTPIHDISPGIDSLGYNRAPVYPVGGAMGNGPNNETSGG